MALSAESLVLEVGRALAPLEQRLRAGEVSLLFAEIGLPAPDAVLGAERVRASIAAAADALAALPEALSDLSGALTSADPVEIARTAANAAPIVKAVFTAIEAIAAEVEAAAETAGPGRAEVEAFAAQLAERLFGFALAIYLERRRPVVAYLFALVGILEITAHAATPAAPAHVRRVLRFERFAALIDDPLDVLAQVYGWGGPDFDWNELLLRLSLFLGRVSGFAFVQPGSPPFLRIALVDIGLTDDPVPGVQAVLRVESPGGLDQALPIGGRAALTAIADAAFELDTAVKLLPPADLRLVPPSSPAEGRLRVGVRAPPAAGGPPIVVLGVPGGSRVEARTLRAAAGADLIWNPLEGHADGELVLEAALEGGKAVLTLAAPDGFLARILPSGPIELDLDLLVRWSSVAGLRLHGDTGLRMTRGVHRQLGPLRLDTLDLAFAAGPDTLTATLTITGAAVLGPVTVTVASVGTAVTLRSGRGNLGLLDAGAAFVPPSGVALAIDAVGVTGGGFVDRDPASGRYSGTLDLHSDKIGITALGLIDTKLPAGHGGYALLLVLRATFPAVQIGFGFALTGVGGLLAVNRRVDVDALRGRLAAGTAGRVLAPQDPIRNAPALLADLDTVFPLTPGITVVGPTLQLLWADLVHLDVGVFIELPGPARVVLLGSAYAKIEHQGRTLLSVRVDIVGVVDLCAATAAFDAVLIDSHLLGMLDLTGGAAFRLSWGAQPYAVLTLGGFHPAYHPEPLAFPATLTRIAMVHGAPDDELYLRFEGYFAITSNTLQFGAAVEAAIRSGGFSIHGNLGFDALIQRVPFHFQIDLRASVSVAYEGHRLTGLTLTGSLTGPGPTVLYAKVCIELLFFDICFSGTFPLGPVVELVTAAVDLLEALAAELANPARLRAGGAPDPHVRLRPPDPALTTPVVAPTGTPVWEQQRAPLGLLVTRVGGAPLAAPTQVTAGDPSSTTSDWFAPGQFLDLSDDEALTRPAYELLAGGLRLAATGVVDGPSAQRTLTTRQIRLPAGATGPDKGVRTFPAWIVAAPGPAAPMIAVAAERWILTGPAGEHGDLTGAQARQLAALTPTAQAVPATDRLAALSF